MVCATTIGSSPSLGPLSSHLWFGGCFQNGDTEALECFGAFQLVADQLVVYASTDRHISAAFRTTRESRPHGAGGRCISASCMLCPQDSP